MKFELSQAATNNLTPVVKFDNAVNFRGFPDIPSSDWVMVHPNQSNDKNGGSRR